MALLVGNVRWPESGAPKTTVARHLGIAPDEVLEVDLVKKSLDARHRKQLYRAVLRVVVVDEAAVVSRGLHGVRVWNARDEGRYGRDAGAPTAKKWGESPVVVGAGPAGLFAALYLAEAGASVVLIERGLAVEPRVDAVNGHWRGKIPLDPNNNLVFGEGGAGTFSDGKIYTRRRDGELGFIFRRLLDFGADPEVMTDALAHLGTDKIRKLLPPMRARLQELGCRLIYGDPVVEILVEQGVATGVRTASGQDIRSPHVVMATGHSARDAVEVMLRAGAAAKPRGIAVGARIEHPQEMVDLARYGKVRGDLPPASYRLALDGDGVQARTFCMCPGGMVVPAGHEPETVVVNGMSFAARRSKWANSAVIVEVPASAYESEEPMAGFAWQASIERLAWEMGGRTGSAPAQRVEDFLAGRASTSLPRTSYPLGVTPADLHELFPAVVTDGMAAAIRSFEGQIEGFAGQHGVLIAPETRTTSPIKFERTEHGESTTVPGLYPAGEGAGYAGGIVSSALDGLRIARGLSLRFSE